jgi:hypothetical protein
VKYQTIVPGEANASANASATASSEASGAVSIKGTVDGANGKSPVGGASEKVGAVSGDAQKGQVASVTDNGHVPGDGAAAAGSPASTVNPKSVDELYIALNVPKASKEEIAGFLSSYAGQDGAQFISSHGAKSGRSARKPGHDAAIERKQHKRPGHGV